MALTWLYFVFGFCLLSAVLCSDWSVSMPQRIEVLSGSCVLIPCTFEVKDENRDEIKDRASEGTKKVSSTLSFTASYLHHGNIICSAAYPLQQGGGSESAEETVALNVLYAPKNTSVSVGPAALVPKGSVVVLACSSNANPQAESYTWFRVSGSEVTAVGWENNLTFAVSEDRGGLYICEAANPHGRQNSTTVRIDVQGVGVAPWIWGVVAGGVLLFCCLLILFICRVTKHVMSPASVSMEALSADNSPIYENASVVKASQGSKDVDEPVYNNSDSACASKAGYASHPPAAAENNYELYANSKVPFRK
ncbi:hypothetical protein AGOR_G00173120 [Albula goreensis]|uniref:Ig-like domain-containing protein n=1 Tax=Albula goreensis TaxID=1534307 RepID=A0A8T3CYP9_9TELE|nr:hypothetical protein AGOR_G00173120 [Albula goreensis]